MTRSLDGVASRLLRAAIAGALALACAVSFAPDAPCAAAAQERSEFARELEARAWALGNGDEGALRRALASDDWTERLRALDALGRTPLARARAARSFGREVEAALDDPRPEVRAAAVRALDGGAPEPGPLERAAPRLAREAAPAVAEALAMRGARLERVPPLELATEWSEELRGRSMRELEASYRPLLDDPGVGDGARVRLRLSLLAAGVELGEAELRRAVEAWYDPDATSEQRQLRLRAARAGGDELGRRLLAGALASDDAQRRFALLDAAAEAIDPATVLGLPLDFDASALVLMLEALALRDLGFAPGELEERGRDLARFARASAPEVRRAAMDLTTTVPAPLAAPLLLAVLEGDAADSPFVPEAFTGLARGPLAAQHQAELHAAWRRRGAAERDAWLRELPRGVPLPAFRDDLLALVDDGPRAEIVELLAPLAEDPVVAQGLAAAFRSEVDALVAAEGLALRLDHDGRAAAVLGATPSLDAQTLERALRRTMDLVHPPDVKTRAKLPKAIVARLGGQLQGASAPRSLALMLAAYLRDDRAPARVRTEVAIVLAHAYPAAVPHVRDLGGLLVEALLHASRTSEPVLATRAIEALGEVAANGGLPADFRQRLAWERFDDPGPRRAALELLVDHVPDARAELLELAFGRGRDAGAAVVIEAAAERGLATEGGGRDFESIVDFARLGALDAGSRRARRDALLLGLSRREAALPAAVSDEVLRRPIAAAQADHAALLAGRDPGAPDFRFGGELALAARLAEDGRFGALLERTEGWWGIEPRTLVTLAERVGRDDPRAAARLAEAALVGFAGLPQSDGAAGPGIGIQPRMRRVLRTQALFAALSTSTAAGESAAAARWADELVVGLVLEPTPHRRLDERTLEAALGAQDPRRRSDPRARLEAARRQLRAAAALDAGDAERARALLDEAQGWVPRSADAALFQAQLEARAAR